MSIPLVKVILKKPYTTLHWSKSSFCKIQFIKGQSLFYLSIYTYTYTHMHASNWMNMKKDGNAHMLKIKSTLNQPILSGNRWTLVPETLNSRQLQCENQMLNLPPSLNELYFYNYSLIKLLKEQKTLKINAPFPSLCLIKKLRTLLTASGNKHPCFGIFPMDINYITGPEQQILQIPWTMSKTEHLAGQAVSGLFFFYFWM